MPDVATIPPGEQSAVDAVERFMQNRDQGVANQPKPAPVEDVQEQEPIEPDQVEGDPTEADPQEVEVQSDEADDLPAEAEDQEPKAEQPDEVEEEFVMPASIEEFAEITETPVDDLLDSMTIRTKVRGQVRDVPLSEIKANWQKGADYELRIAQQKEEFNADRQREKERSEQHQQSLAYLGHAVMEYKALTDELTEDLIDQVRSNYGDDAARLINQIRRRLIGAGENSVKQYNEQYQKFTEGAQNASAEAVKANTQAFINANPEMADQAKAMDTMKSLTQHLLSRGMSADAVQGLWAVPGADIIVSLMLEAKDAAEVKKQTKVVKRKIKGFPKKQVKPGATKTEGMKKAARKRGVADLVQQASAAPKDSNLQRLAGVESVRQYMENR